MARCLISPLTSFISSPDVLQDVFLVLMAKVLQSEVNVGPRCANSAWARQGMHVLSLSLGRSSDIFGLS